MRKAILFLLFLLLATLACGQRGTSPTPTEVAPPTDGAALTPEAAPTTRLSTDPGIDSVPSATESASPISAPPVPETYQPLYDSLQGALTQFQDAITPEWDGSRSGAVIAAEMLVANGNLGEQLLAPETMDSVRLFLDALAQTGATGVSMQVSYPLLVPDYPRADEYLAFYKEAAQEVKNRGLVLMIESSPVFAGTQYSGVPVDYSGLDAQSYFTERQEMLVIVAREIQPAYLSLADEPDTEQKLTGLELTLDDYVRFVQNTVAAIGPDSGVLIGAGNGSWLGLDHIRAYATQTDVDFINVHVYPIIVPGQDPLANIASAAQIARENGKSIVIGEAWLYKADSSDLTQAGVSLGAYYDRDAFSFWQPLDAQFMETLALLGDIYDFRLISFFWSRYFFAYLDYAPNYGNMRSPELLRQANRASAAGMSNGTITDVGRLLGELSSR